MHLKKVETKKAIYKLNEIFKEAILEHHGEQACGYVIDFSKIKQAITPKNVYIVHGFITKSIDADLKEGGDFNLLGLVIKGNKEDGYYDVSIAKEADINYKTAIENGYEASASFLAYIEVLQDDSSENKVDKVDLELCY
jgi:hypothetical protein